MKPVAAYKPFSVKLDHRRFPKVPQSYFEFLAISSELARYETTTKAPQEMQKSSKKNGQREEH